MAVRLERAKRADDPDLVDFLLTCPMPGRISLCLDSAPSFFRAQRVEGEFGETLIARLASGRIVGVGSLRVRRAYLNAQPMSIGYLSGLKIDKDFRKSTLLARGFKLLREIHQELDPDICITSIMSDNFPARSILQSGKAGIPTYQPFSRYQTRLITPKSIIKKLKADPTLQVSGLVESEIDEWIAFLRQEGEKKDFFPVFDKRNFSLEDSGFLGMSLSDIYTARREGKLVATAALWSQSKLRRWKVLGYHKGLSLIRSPYNFWARSCGHVQLPKIGESLPIFNLSLVAVENNEQRAFLSLLLEVARRLKSPSAVIAMGMCESDPLLSSVSSIAGTTLRSELFEVQFEKNSREVEFRIKNPHIEVGML